MEKQRDQIGSIHCERYIISRIMVENDLAFVAQDLNLKADHFTDYHLSMVYRVIMDLSKNVFVIDSETIWAVLEKEGQKLPVEFRMELIELGSTYVRPIETVNDDEMVVPANFPFHVRAVQEAWIKRQFVKAAGIAARSSEFVSNDVFNIMEIFHKEIEPIYELLNRRPDPDFQDLLIETTQEAEISMKSESAMIGISSGFADLDRKLGGFTGGKLYLIAGRPAMGKTGLATSMVLNMLLNGVRVGFLSLEMTAKDLVMRIKSNLASVSLFDIATKRIDKHDIVKLARADEKLFDKQLHISDESAPTIGEVRVQARKWVNKHQIEILFVDYIQLVKADDSRKKKFEAVGDVAYGLHNLSKDLDIPVVALAQVSREAEKEPDKRPKMRHLSDSSDLEKAAYLIAFMFRPEYYGLTSELGDEAGLCELKIEKHRNGPTGVIPLGFVKEYTRFTNYQSPQNTDYYGPEEEDLQDEEPF